MSDKPSKPEYFDLERLAMTPPELLDRALSNPSIVSQPSTLTTPHVNQGREEIPGGRLDYPPIEAALSKSNPTKLHAETKYAEKQKGFARRHLQVYRENGETVFTQKYLVSEEASILAQLINAKYDERLSEIDSNADDIEAALRLFEKYRTQSAEDSTVVISAWRAVRRLRVKE